MTDLWLSYGQKKVDLTGYADADESMAEDWHAISGYAFIIHGGAVSWSAKCQEIVSLLTTESEYIAATYEWWIVQRGIFVLGQTVILYIAIMGSITAMVIYFFKEPSCTLNTYLCWHIYSK